MKPVQGYFSGTARLAMADTADTALRRIARDVRLALPNTVRVDASGMFLEFIPIKTGGRYLDNDACFVSPGCTSLSTMGDMLEQRSGHDGLGPGFDLQSVQQQSVELRVVELRALQRVLRERSRRTLASATGAGTSSNTLGFASTVFVPPGGSPTRRIFIISASPVTYACDAATATLWRISGYTRQAAQPATLAAAPLARRYQQGAARHQRHLSSHSGRLAPAVLLCRRRLGALQPAVGMDHAYQQR